jgi:ABC-type polysaccharide/polyol phosphate transport system ATPase subunit
MLLSRSARHAHELPDEVLVSVQGVTRAVAPPDPQLPQWLARVLPKSGLAGTGALVPDVGVEEEVDEEVDLEVGEDERAATLKEISFEVRRGEGVGILGPDNPARRVLFRILTGALPPTTGLVLVRGRIAPVIRGDLEKLSTPDTGRRAVFLAARFLQWPQSLLRKRWREIVDFAQLDELSDLPPAKYQRRSTDRLLLSAALHLDVDVYLFDEANLDPAFAVRCVERLEQRKREGAAVIQAGRMSIENLGRLCGEVMWLEDGCIAYRGRPVDVAVEVERGHKEVLHPLSTPLLASLADSGPVALQSEGATVEIELHALRKNLDIVFTLQLDDWNGRQAQLSQSESFRATDPGLYRLRIFLPAGLLSDGTHEARLIAEVGVRGSEPAPPRELLAFEVVATGQDEAEAGDDGLTFELLLDDDEVGKTVDDVEWRVSRTSS